MKKTLWALLDDRAGSVGQARGIMQAIADDFAISEKKIVYNKLAALPNCLLGATFALLNKQQSDDLSAPYPDVVLSISRRTTPIARKIKKLSHGKTKIIQLIYPGKCGLRDLDLVIVPEHDRKSSAPQNVYYITGCPHRITEQNMAQARAEWTPVFASLPQPLTTIAVGGAIKGKPFSLENARQLGREIRHMWEKTGGSLLLTTSRRTGEAAQQAIMAELKGIPAYTYLWGEKKDNPIMGFWACADKIIVTGDSVSMCCEACGSGKPVLIFCGQKWLTAKHLRFVRSLYDGGYATALESPEALTFKPQQRLNPIDGIVAKINQLNL